MKCWLLPTLTLLIAACTTPPEKPSSPAPPAQGGFKYHAQVPSVPAGASSLRVRLRLPDDSVRPTSGSGLVGNAPLLILQPDFILDADSYSMTMGPAEVTWSRKADAGERRLELDIQTQARPIELTLNLVPQPGTTVDVDALKQELDRGFTVLADGKPIEAGATRLERSTPVTTVPSSAPR